MSPNTLIIRCCYLGMFIQAMVINLTPLLFVPLRDQFGLTFEQLGRLVLINFTTQMLVDIICAAVIDRVPVKPLIVAANVLAGAGLCLFAWGPTLFDMPYTGLALGTVVFSTGCGLLEVLLSPIINAVPSERKAGDMALLHSFYAIGKVTVIIVTAAALWLLGTHHWRLIVLFWTVLPVVNTFGFSAVKLPPLAHPETRTSLRSMIRTPALTGLVIAMVLAGGSELAISQWTSAFAQEALGFSQQVSDLVGFCLFGVGMGIGRLWFGFKGEGANLRPVLIASSAATVAVYLVASLSPWPVLSLAACATGGLTVSLLWPGILSLSTARFPLAGGSMFALLAAAGDTGCAVMPWLVGLVADRSSLSIGLLVATTCPAALILVLLLLRPRRAAAAAVNPVA